MPELAEQQSKDYLQHYHAPFVGVLEGSLGDDKTFVLTKLTEALKQHGAHGRLGGKDFKESLCAAFVELCNPEAHVSQTAGRDFCMVARLFFEQLNC
jgi:hypothetical protein